MAIRLVHSRKSFDYRNYHLFQEWRTHRGGRIVVEVWEESLDSSPPKWKVLAGRAEDLAWDTYYDLLEHGKSLAKDYIIEG